jgi:nicotinate phosphoribosyltransferase
MPTTSILATDAYKLSMAQAGFPLRPETFYFSFRRGGFQCVAFDLAASVREVIAAIRHAPADLEFARAHGYGFTDAMLAALSEAAPVEIVAVPEGCWVWEREPILSITGPSFLVSWLEPMLLWLNVPIQLGTWLSEHEQIEPAIVTATCEEHEALLQRIADDVHVKLPPIVRENDAYQARVAAQVRTLVDAAGGDPSRIFEVGMRSAVCMQQHRLALQACAEVGVSRTSNLLLAKELGMTPVGTMGHEHVQRWGADLPAFRAMRDMRTGAPSYLLDTFDTMRSGTLAALDVMRERAHPCSIRYDSGNKYIQYLHACELFHQAALQPTHVLEDGLDLEMTRHFERLREFTAWPATGQHYGYGGTIVAAPMTNPLSRDRVGAVYKLSETAGEPRMKFGDEADAGKQSVPGRPVVWRRVRGDGPIGIIGQAGEPVHDNYVLLSGNPDAREQLRLCNVLDLSHTRSVRESHRVAAYSPETTALVKTLDRRARS